MTITFTLTSGSSATAAGPFNISGTTSGGGLNTVLIATGVTKTQLLTGHTVTNVTPENITGGTITSIGTCNTTTNWYTTPTPTPTGTPLAEILTVTSGTYPASGGSGVSVQGTIRVTGGNVNLWAKHVSGGNSSGTSNFSGTFNSVTVTGTYTIMASGQPGWTNSGGTTSSGYVTLTPGDYDFTITKSDNLTSGATVSVSWSTGTIGNQSTTLTYLN
jgi:hypothetical protein